MRTVFDKHFIAIRNLLNEQPNGHGQETLWRLHLYVRQYIIFCNAVSFPPNFRAHQLGWEANSFAVEGVKTVALTWQHGKS